MLLAPRISRGHFFLTTFFRVMHDGLSERGTTRSLAISELPFTGSFSKQVLMQSHVNLTHFHTSDCAPGLTLIRRLKGIWKWAIQGRNIIVYRENSIKCDPFTTIFIDT